MTFAMKQIVGGVLAMALAVSGGMALAKAHDQGQTANPGQNVQSETVDMAHGLGAALGAGVARHNRHPLECAGDCAPGLVGGKRYKLGQSGACRVR